REGKHCRCRKRRAPPKRSCGKAQVVHEISQPSGQPDIAHFLPDLCDTAQFQRGLPSGLLLLQTGEHQVIYAAIDVVLQFAIQAALQIAETDPVPKLFHHPFPLSKINWTAPVSRAQPSFSTASCFRPEEVKE